MKRLTNYFGRKQEHNKTIIFELTTEVVCLKLERLLEAGQITLDYERKARIQLLDWKLARGRINQADYDYCLNHYFHGEEH